MKSGANCQLSATINQLRDEAVVLRARQPGTAEGYVTARRSELEERHARRERVRSGVFGNRTTDDLVLLLAKKSARRQAADSKAARHQRAVAKREEEEPLRVALEAQGDLEPGAALTMRRFFVDPASLVRAAAKNLVDRSAALLDVTHTALDADPSVAPLAGAAEEPGERQIDSDSTIDTRGRRREPRY